MNTQYLQYILGSTLDPQLNQELINKYKLDGPMSQKLIGIIGDLLNQKITIDQLSNIVSREISLPKAKIDKLVADIVGMRMLPLNSAYQGKPQAWLGEHGIAIDAYKEFVERTREVIETELDAESSKEDQAPIEPEVIAYAASDPIQEKKDALDIFASGMVDFFLAESESVHEIIYDYNLILLELLDANPGFNKQLEDALYTNEERLTSVDITVDGKVVAPTIGNWLRDFISSHGGGDFNTVTASQYVTNSQNARTLSTSERQLLVKLLTLYRTLHFFPASLNGIPPEQWQVIPVSLPQEEQKSAPKRRARRVAKDPVEQQLQQLMTEYDLKNLTGIEQRALLDQYHITQDQFKNFIQNNG